MLVSGCVNYQPEPISAAANARTLDTRSLDDPRLRQFVAMALHPDGDSHAVKWDLTSLTLAALYDHPDLELAHAKLAAAEAAVVTAGEHPNPVLNFTNIVGQGLVPGAIPIGAAPLTIGPVVDFVLETFGKREARTAQAQHLADAARYDIATAAWQVRGRVRAALLALWAAERRLALTKQRLASEQELVDLLEHRFATGEASSLDLQRERINREEIDLSFHELQQTADEARAQLATAIGIPVEALDGADFGMSAFDRPPPIAANPGDWRREALSGRSDVQASLADYAAAQSALRLAVADQFPNLVLSPGYTYEYGINQYTLNFNTTLPIFNQNQGPIAEAFAKRQEAAATFTALQAQVIGAIDEAAIAYRKSTQTLAVADTLLADEQHRTQQMESSFRAGQIDRPTLVAAEAEEAATALARFDAVVRQREALGSLEDALQHSLYGPDFMSAPPAESST
jgi:cobalt-zinc-cadmium efflux system outer membrane protein